MEDDPMIALMLADMVVDLGHTLGAVVQTVDEAIEEIHVDQPDVVLLDLNLRGKVSFEVAYHCTVKGIPVILTTGYDENFIPEELKHCRVLSKPFGSDELENAILKAAQQT